MGAGLVSFLTKHSHFGSDSIHTYTRSDTHTPFFLYTQTQCVFHSNPYVKIINEIMLLLSPTLLCVCNARLLWRCSHLPFDSFLYSMFIRFQHSIHAHKSAIRKKTSFMHKFYQVIECRHSYTKPEKKRTTAYIKKE